MKLFFGRKRFDVGGDLQRRALALNSEAVQLGKETSDFDQAAVRIRIVQDAFHDFTLYSVMGRDRRKLGPEWGERMEARVREQWEMFA